MLNGSQIIIEACARAGADVFIGYPITPANELYEYASKRIPIFRAAPDEISSLQWMAGFSAVGKFPVTATSFPGMALMIETLNMAFMMELPMLVILAQRMGPSTGSATTGTQGDLLLLRGAISGGFPIPVFCPADFSDCWTLTHEAIKTSIKLRTPVVLLTSKEMVLTDRCFDPSDFTEIERVPWPAFKDGSLYLPYKAGDDLVPPFLPLGNDRQRVRLNASTHDESGVTMKQTKEALNNTERLKKKVEKHLPDYFHYKLDHEEGSDTLILTYGVTAEAAKDAIAALRSKDVKVSLLVVKTLLPASPKIHEILNRYEHVVFVEENLSGLYMEILFGQKIPEGVSGLFNYGTMIFPRDIEQEVLKCRRA